MKWLLVLFFVASCAAVFQSRHDADKKRYSAPRDNNKTAKYVCAEFVKKTLHDPDSAQLDNYNGYTTTQEAGVYTVLVTGRAKNGFGAMRNSVFECKTTLTGGEWVGVGVRELGQ